jgi:hypothetical protein
MTELFLSYRTDDSVHATMAMSDQLADHFGRTHVFRDHDSLLLGMVYPHRIRRALERCGTVLAVIGPHWLSARDARGRRRIDNTRDWVRTELRMAFEREIPVVPVLLDGTPLPTRQQLPGDIGLLSLSTYHQVRHQSFADDVRTLIEKLGGQIEKTPPATYTQISHAERGGVIYSTQNGNQYNNNDGTHR